MSTREQLEELRSWLDRRGWEDSGNCELCGANGIMFSVAVGTEHLDVCSACREALREREIIRPPLIRSRPRRLPFFSPMHEGEMLGDDVELSSVEALAGLFLKSLLFLTVVLAGILWLSGAK